MPNFFIQRPIFAWVVAIFIALAGIISIHKLPIEQYPSIAPPTISLTVAYPGADAKTIETAVISIIELQMNSVENLEYMQSTSLSNGTGTITLTFKSGTDPDINQVNVQNQLAQVQSRLPSSVVQSGISISKQESGFLLFAMFVSDSETLTTSDISDYVARDIQPEIQRLEGVGNVNLFGSEKSMRIWVDTEKLRSLDLTATDVSNAIASQNIQIPAGSLAALPNDDKQIITTTVVSSGQLMTEEEFGNIILKSTDSGAIVRISDVARVEIGSQSYHSSARLNGKPAVGIGVQLSTNGNALETANLVKQKLAELQKFFPAGMSWDVPYDTSTFVSISIEKVLYTLLEAIFLVFVVLLLFLQNIRYTLIPIIVVPIALLGTLAIMDFAGFSINVLTMFAMVLVIGIVVDDAIVVVENVERVMSEEKLSPFEATKKAMSQITGAVIGITLVLIAVFIPLAFFSGSTGNIYRQFSIVMGVSIFFSAFLALSLTPALCTTLLKPITEYQEKKGFYGWFNRKFDTIGKRYSSFVAKILKRTTRMIIIYASLTCIGLFMLTRLQTAFLPEEDQGYVISLLQLPSDATRARTLESFEKIEAFLSTQPEVEDVISVLGFSFVGQGQNVGLGFTTLKDWSERSEPSQGADAIAQRITGAMLGILKDGYVFAVSPPAIPGLGTSSGFDFVLEDRGNKGYAALEQARDQLLGLASQSKIVTQVRNNGLDDTPQLRIEIDRDLAAVQNVQFSSIANVISVALGSNYVNDFPNAGRMQRVIVQADAKDRLKIEDILKLTVNNSSGNAVPLSSLVKITWETGPLQTVRYNGYPSMSITGEAAEGYSSGDAIAEMEYLASQLPDGFGYEWTGLSREEILAGNQAFVLYSLSILAVFLCLAALYESWAIPLSVMLVVPLGLLGVVLGIWGRNFDNDVYFQVGLITVIGLSAKNAILIVEFAKDLQAQGETALQAALHAARLRFRPIMMTSIAFILGVVPLYIASGASSASQRAIGTSVFWGMLLGSILALLFVPTFYALVRSIFPAKEVPLNDNQQSNDKKI